MQQAGYKRVTKKVFSLEVCVDSLQSAIAAAEGGADRIELCNSLSEGGTTPSAGMIEAARKIINIGLHVLIRPRRGDFLYSAPEFEVMKKDIEIAKALGAEGVVLGILKEDGSIDIARVQELIAIARPLSITFHRAFDLTSAPFKALDELIALQVDRLLSSGQQPSALQGAPLLRELIKRADKRLTVMPGGGISPENIQEIIAKTGATEFHTSARKKTNSQMSFRREQLAMAGTQTLTEYEQLIADPAGIFAIREAGISMKNQPGKTG